MKRQPAKVRQLVYRSVAGAGLLNLGLFLFIFIVAMFDLEDKIFVDQVALATKQLAAEDWRKLDGSGPVSAVQMHYYRGRQNLPLWLLAELENDEMIFPAEVFAKERGHFHIDAHALPNGETLFVAFNARPFIKSTPQIVRLFIVFAILLVLVSLVSFLYLRGMIKSLSHPLEAMTAHLASFGAAPISLDILNKAPAEIQALGAALNARDARIDDLLTRERAFNRDASHELRTPLAIASGALEVLEESRQQPLPAFQRLQKAVRDMQSLTEGILWLGRDPVHHQYSNVTDVAAASIKAYQHHLANRDVKTRIEGDDHVLMPVPEPVAQVIIGNLVRNALSYTDKGGVIISAQTAMLTIKDTGVGFGSADEEKQGFGIGLSLVQRLCAHFDIQIEFEAPSEGGTKVRLRWQ